MITDKTTCAALKPSSNKKTSNGRQKQKAKEATKRLSKSKKPPPVLFPHHYVGPFGRNNVPVDAQRHLYKLDLEIGTIVVGSFVRVLEYTGPGSDEEDSSTKAPPMSFGVVVDLRELRIGRPTEQNPASICILQLWDSPMSHLDEELYQKHHDGRDGAQMQLFATNMHSWVSPEAIKELLNISCLKPEDKPPLSGHYFKYVHYSYEPGQKGNMFPAHDKKGNRLWPWLVMHVHNNSAASLGGNAVSSHLYPIFNMDIEAHYALNDPLPELEWAEESKEEGNARGDLRVDVPAVTEAVSGFNNENYEDVEYEAATFLIHWH